MARKAVHLTPDGQTRKDRRALAREIAHATRVVDGPATKGGLNLPPAPVGVLGAGSETGGYVNPVPMRVEPHRATSQHLAGIYPFVADSGIGSRGPIMGVDLNADSLWHFSPWDAYADPSDRGTLSTNVLVLGAYRAGKSATIKTLVYRSLAFGHQCVLPSDSKGEWVTLAGQVGGAVIRLGGTSTTRLNPLARGPRRTGASDAEHEKIVQQRRITTLVTLMQMAMDTRALAPAEHAALDRALTLAIDVTDDRPTLREVYRQLGLIAADDVGEEKEVVAAATQPRFVLRRFVTGDLSGLFEDESSVEFDDAAPMVVVDTSELFQRSELVAQMAQVCTTAWIQAVISDRDSHRTRYLVREEGWRDMSSLAALLMYQQWLKLSRHYGIANIVILHKMGDVDAVGEAGSQERNLAYSVLGDIENKFIFRINQQEEVTLRDRLNLPAGHVATARTLRKGEFLAYVGRYAYLVDCFSTSTEIEYEMFKTDDAIMTDRTVPESAVGGEVIDINELWPEPVQPDEDLDAWLHAGGTA